MTIEINHHPGEWTDFDQVLLGIYSPEQIAAKNDRVNFNFLHATIVVHQNGKPAGRCCIYKNPDLFHEGHRAMSFGNYECINDTHVARALNSEIEKMAIEEGFEYIVGPMNGSTWENYRIGCFTNEQTFFLEPFNPDFYHDQFKENGFHSIARYVSNRDDSEHLLNDRTEKASGYFRSMGIQFRNIDLGNYKNELTRMHGFCMDAFRNNFLFTPVSANDFISKYEPAAKYIKPEFVVIAEDNDKNICGLIFCLPNYSDKEEKGLIIKTLAKKNSVRYGGMGNILTSMIKQRARQSGYSYLIHAFMHESNSSKNLSLHFSGSVIREYYLYGKSITRK